MNCAKCGADIGNGGVGQEDGTILCVACDQAVVAGFSFDGATAEKALDTDRSKEQKRAALHALAFYGKKKSPHLRMTKNAMRAAQAGSGERMLGAGLAIFGAADDNPYAFSAGLHVNQAGHIEGVRAEARVLARSRRVTTVDPALTRMLAERGGSLTKQPLKSRTANTRWMDTVANVSSTPQGIHGQLIFTQMRTEWTFDLTFDEKVGLWTIDIENGGKWTVTEIKK